MTAPDAERPFSQRVTGYRWEFDVYHPSQREVLPAIRRFASDVLLHRRLKVTPYWLTILGPSGVGKTLILQQCFELLADLDYTWPIRTGEDGSSRTPRCAHIIPGDDLDDYKAAREYAHHDLIYLEDYGAVPGVVMDRATELLLYRPRHWTLIDANMSLREMGERCPRIASRLLRDGSQLIEIPMDCPDYNLR